MGNELSTYDFNNNSIRVIEIEGEAWFPAKDVYDLLGISQPSTSVKHRVPEEDYRHVLRSDLPNSSSNRVSFPNRGMLCVNESGLYDLIGVSRKPEARAFRKWVNGTILPSIRKRGGYIAGQEKIATGEMSSSQFMARAVNAANKKIESLRPWSQRSALVDLAPTAPNGSHSGRHRAEGRVEAPHQAPETKSATNWCPLTASRPPG